MDSKYAKLKSLRAKKIRDGLNSRDAFSIH